MSPLLRNTSNTSEGFPRVSGDEPSTMVKAAISYAFSPRERG